MKNLYRYFHDYYEWGTEEWHHFIHHILEIEPGSECAKIIEMAMHEAVQTDGPAPKPPRNLNQNEYENRQLAEARARARLLGRTYWRMRRDLEKEQCPTAALDDFMEGEVRGSITVTRGEASNEPFMVEIVEADFQAAREDSGN